MTHIQTPEYQLLASKQMIEIRDYPPLIFAEVEVKGQRKQAISEGFKILADYIFGNNTAAKKIEATGSATVEESEKIAMTAPVIQEKFMDKWKVRFVMPKKYRLATLPKPHAENIRLISSPAKRFAVIRFSGLASDENISQRTEALREYILAEKWEPLGGVVLAFYNPPWTLPFLRRNEIMIEIGIH